jgi:hypothetical protein
METLLGNPLENPLVTLPVTSPVIPPVNPPRTPELEILVGLPQQLRQVATRRRTQEVGPEPIYQREGKKGRD